jgi:hypothetical protein
VGLGRLGGVTRANPGESEAHPPGAVGLSAHSSRRPGLIASGSGALNQEPRSGRKNSRMSCASSSGSSQAAK